jgi:hypothetical protein
MKTKALKKLSHDDRLTKCEEFLKSFEDYDFGEIGPAYEHYGRKKYLINIVDKLLCSKRLLMERAKFLKSYMKTWSPSLGRKMKKS